MASSSGSLNCNCLSWSPKTDLARQTERIVYMVGKARRNSGPMDLVVFPEYSLHGLSMDTVPAIMCSLDGPEVAVFRRRREQRFGAAFRDGAVIPPATRTTGPVIDDRGRNQAVLSKTPSVDNGRTLGAGQFRHSV